MDVGGRIAFAVFLYQHRVPLALADFEELSIGLATQQEPGIRRVGPRALQREGDRGGLPSYRGVEVRLALEIGRKRNRGPQILRRRRPDDVVRHLPRNLVRAYLFP